MTSERPTLTSNSSCLCPAFLHRTSVEEKIGQYLSSHDTHVHNVWKTARTMDFKFNSRTRYRLLVVSLSLSPSCVTRKKTARKKMAVRTPWGEPKARARLATRIHAAIFFPKRKRNYSYLLSSIFSPHPPDCYPGSSSQIDS